MCMCVCVCVLARTVSGSVTLSTAYERALSPDGSSSQMEHSSETAVRIERIRFTNIISMCSVTIMIVWSEASRHRYIHSNQYSLQSCLIDILPLILYHRLARHGLHTNTHACCGLNADYTRTSCPIHLPNIPKIRRSFISACTNDLVYMHAEKYSLQLNLFGYKSRRWLHQLQRLLLVNLAAYIVNITLIGSYRVCSKSLVHRSALVRCDHYITFCLELWIQLPWLCGVPGDFCIQWGVYDIYTR